MRICLTTVTLHLCRYICVPRQVFSELLCNKDTQRIAGKCFIWGSTLKDICSCKSVLGHPSREDDSEVQKKKKKKEYTVELLLAKIWYQKQCFIVQHHRVFYFQNHSGKHFPKCLRFLFLTSNVWEATVQKLQVPIAGPPDPSSIFPYITEWREILTSFPPSSPSPTPFPSPSLSPFPSLSLSLSRSLFLCLLYLCHPCHPPIPAHKPLEQWPHEHFHALYFHWWYFLGEFGETYMLKCSTLEVLFSSPLYIFLSPLYIFQ